MLSPTKTKFRKCFKGKIHGHAYTSCSIKFGMYALKSMDSGRLTSKQIEACRKCIVRILHHQGKYWCRQFPHKPVTAKPADSRMGGGKGPIDRYVAVIYKGTILFELDGISEELAKKAFISASHKLPFNVKFIKKEEGVFLEY